MARQWVRWYTEWLHDPKRAMLTLAEQGLWSLLVAMAGASSEPGVLRVCEGVPYTPETMALALGLRPEDTALVGPALDKFERLRMIHVHEDGAIELINFRRRQYDHPSDYPEAARARKQKQREAARGESIIKGSDSHECVTSVSRESHEAVTPLTEQIQNRDRTDTDGGGLDHDSVSKLHALASEIPGQGHHNHHAELTRDAGLAACLTTFEREFGRPLSPMEVEQITGLYDAHGLDLVREALRRAVVLGKRNLRYIDRILAGWRDAGLRTIAELQDYEARREQARAAAASGPGQAPDPGKVADLERKRQAEKVKAALAYLRLTCGRDPTPEQIEQFFRDNDYGPGVKERVIEILREEREHGAGG